MSDWDEESDQLRANLQTITATIRADALKRAMPSVEAARQWHRTLMSNLAVPKVEYVGAFRGELDLKGHEVAIGRYFGVPSQHVLADLNFFESRLLELVETLDALIPPRGDLNADQLAAVINVCAWTHAEWIRIHPFVNGNGRTARLWAISIAMRYGLPPFLRAHPRPEGSYEAAANAAMKGNWRPTARLFRQMYQEAIRP